MSEEQIRQMQQWYADPIRELPRKVKQDVAALLRELKLARARGAALEEAGKALTEAHSVIDAGCDPPGDFTYDKAWHRFWQVLYGQTEEEAAEAEAQRQRHAHEAKRI